MRKDKTKGLFLSIQCNILKNQFPPEPMQLNRFDWNIHYTLARLTMKLSPFFG